MSKSYVSIWSWIIAIAIACLLQAGVRAEEASEEEPVVEMSEMVVTASRGERSSDTVAADITVINAEDIARSNATNIPNLLREVAGVHVFDFLNNGASANVGIGGFGETGNLNTVVLVDGVRIDFADLAGVDWTSIPLNQVERIEVLRGGNSALYGNGATGGVINIITKSGGKNTVSARGEVHSWGYREKTSVSGKLGPLGYNVTQGYEDSEGYRTNNYYRSNNVHLGLSLEPVDSPFELKVGYGHNEEDFGLPGSLPLAALKMSTLDYDDSTSPNDYGERTTDYLTVTPAVVIAGDHRFEVPITYRERYGFFFYDFAPFGTYEVEHRDVTWGVAPQYTGKFDLGEMDYTLTLGAEHYNSQKHSIQNSLEATRKTSDVFINNSLELVPGLTLDAGYRHGRAEFDFDGFEDVAYEMEAYHGGLTYTYKQGSKVFASYDRSYRVGVLDEYIVYPAFPASPFVNERLKPQITETWKAGVKHRVGDPLTVAVTGFYMETEDEIFYDPNDGTYNPFFPGANRNYDETRRYGFTTDLTSDPTEWLGFYASYTWMDARFGEDDTTNYDGNRVPMVPMHSVRAGTQLRLCGFTYDLGGRWIDNQYMTSDWYNTNEELDSYVVLDTKLTYEWKWLKVFAGVNNLTDEEYAEVGIGGTSVYPSPGRSFFAGAEVTLTY